MSLIGRKIETISLKFTNKSYKHNRVITSEAKYDMDKIDKLNQQTFDQYNKETF